VPDGQPPVGSATVSSDRSRDRGSGSGSRSKSTTWTVPPTPRDRAIVRRRRAKALDESAATEVDVRNRQRIADAGRAVFSRDGFHGARIVDVAAEAQLGVGTVYRHFNSKAEIFEAVIREVIDEIYYGGRSHLLHGDGSVIARIDAANRSFFDLYRRSANLMATLNHLATQDEQFRSIYFETRRRSAARIERAIKRLQSDGEANPDLDAAMAADALISMMDNVAFVAFRLGGEFDDADMATLNQMWVGALGLCTPRVVALPT